MTFWSKLVLIHHQILLQVQYHIPHLIVVPDVVTGQHIHRFCVFWKRPRVVWMHNFFLLETERTQPWKESHNCVLEKEPNHCQQGNDQKVRQVHLSNELLELDLFRQCYRNVNEQVWWFEGFIGCEHPATEERASHNHDGEECKRIRHELNSQSLNFTWKCLNDRARSNVPGKQADEG